MTNSTSPIDPDRDPVDVLAEEFAARVRRGETPSISEYVQRYPEHADQIAALFPSVALLEQIGSPASVDDNSPDRPSQERLPPHHLIGDFEILREIGRGGMGVVYEAVQHSLQRLVAMKVLSAGAVHSDQHALRFEREARAAAQLHHTNIVPVFGVGEQDGLRYYVMQRILGLGLDTVLAELARQSGRKSSRHSSESDGTSSISAGELAGVLISGELSNSRSSAVTRSRSEGSAPASDATHTAASATAIGDTSQTDEETRPSEIATREFVHSSLILRDEDNPTLDQTNERFASNHDGSCDEPTRSRRETEARSFDLAASRSQAAEVFGQRYWRNVARVGVQVAAGLHYAHSQGTLHRDIKPANILLDADGTAWIADFGLAKVLEADEITRTGDIVGTLRYMAPEQLRGESDARSDIYSLGLTLYELLKVGPAYDETDRQQLIARKLTPHDLPSLRRQFPDLPRDLETIVLKCVAYEADERYASAGAVVADLQAFLDDQPIQARQVSSAERLWRWCRRNPAVAALSGTVAALLLLTAGLTSAGYVHEQRLRARADEETAKAERIAGVVFEAFDALGRSFVSDNLTASVQLDEEDSEEQLHVPIISPETAALLEQVRSSFDQLAEVVGTDDRFRDYAAKADLRAGELHLRLNQWAEAEDAFSRAIELYEQPGTALDDPETQLRQARLYNGRGIAAAAQHQRDESREAHEQALTFLDDDLKQPEETFELARTHFLIGRRLSTPGMSGGRPPEDGGHRGTGSPNGISHREVRPPEHGSHAFGSPGSPRPGRRGGSQRRGGGRFARGQREDDLKHLQRAAELFAQLAASDPSSADNQFWLAQCYLESSSGRSAKMPETDDRRMEAIAILEDLVDTHPNKPDYLYQLSEAYEQSYKQWSPGWMSLVAEDLVRTSDFRSPEEAARVEADMREALRVSDELLGLQPHVPGYAMSNLLLQIRLIDVVQSRGEAADAREMVDRAVASRDSAKTHFPEMEQFTGFLGAVVDHMRVKQLMAQEDYAAARDILQTLIARFDTVVERSSPERGHGRRVPREIVVPVYRRLLMCLTELEEDEEASQLQTKLETLLQDKHHRPRRGSSRRPPSEL